MSSVPARKKVAVVGAGISGITAAYLLHNQHDVTLFERNSYVGGHTNTFVLKEGVDSGTAVDTGFIVLNDKTYPNLHRLLAAWGVDIRFSDMSFGFHCEESGLQYSGRGINGLFAQRRNLFRPLYLRFIGEIVRFCKTAAKDLEMKTIQAEKLVDYLSRHKFSARLIHDYIVPMGAAIWSAPPQQILQFPAAVFLQFFFNHGLLALKDRPRWQTIVGGSHQYVRAFTKCFAGNLEINCEISGITRSENEVKIESKQKGIQSFDEVILAVHADQVLPLLRDSSTEEREIFSKWTYQKNHTVLHTDTSVLPPNKRAWASWNYLRSRVSGKERLSVTYDMNRLQGLQTNARYCVTLNSATPIDSKRIITEIEYEHPVFTLDAIDARERLKVLNGQRRTRFCGAYFGFGFHEDGVKSGMAVAQSLTY